MPRCLLQNSYLLSIDYCLHLLLQRVMFDKNVKIDHQQSNISLCQNYYFVFLVSTSGKFFFWTEFFRFVFSVASGIYFLFCSNDGQISSKFMRAYDVQPRLQFSVCSLKIIMFRSETMIVLHKMLKEFTKLLKMFVKNQSNVQLF